MDYITLMGAEDVQKAGNQMAQAAQDMIRAANQIDESLNRFLQRWEETIYPMLVVREDGQE